MNEKLQSLEPYRLESGLLMAFVFPGGYPLFYLDRENSILCSECANASDQDTDEVPQFRIVAAGVNWEDETLVCDQCGKQIESAYGGEA